jgi:beta-lactam-binding protein with PASTA domain
MTASKAKDALARRGFSTVPTDTYSDDVPKGKVVSTEPEAGAVADEGSEVTLHVSVGPEFEEVTMPDVRGLSVAAARKKLAKLGLRVEIVQSCGGHGATVVESDPVARDTTMEGDVAGLFVC